MHGPDSTLAVLLGTPPHPPSTAPGWDRGGDTATSLRGFLPRLLEELQENTSFRNKTLEEEGTRVHTESGRGAHGGKALGLPWGRAQQHPPAGRGWVQGHSRGWGAAEAPALCLRSPAAGVAGDKGAETWPGTRGQKQPGNGRVAGVGEGLPRPRAAAPRCTWSKMPQPGALLR